MIDILVPVLNRPNNVVPFLDGLRANTQVKVRVIFLCSIGDEDEIRACSASGEDVRVCAWASDHDYPRKMNYGFTVGSNPWVFLGADDIEFQPGWDTNALMAAEKTGALVVGLNDMAHPDVKKGRTSTHPLVNRRYVTEQGAALDGPGVLIHEGYDHNYSERELNCLAQSRLVWTFARNACVKHKHPAWGTADIDDTYIKGRRSIGVDHQLFLTRSFQWGGVGLTPSEKNHSRRFVRRAQRLAR